MTGRSVPSRTSGRRLQAFHAPDDLAAGQHHGELHRAWITADDVELETAICIQHRVIDIRLPETAVAPGLCFDVAHVFDGLGRRVLAHHERGVHIRKRSQVGEVLHAPFADLGLRQLDEPDGFGEEAQQRAVPRSEGVEELDCAGAAAARARLHQNLRVPRDESAEMGGREPGVQVIRAAGRMADQDGDGLAAVELLDRILRPSRQRD